MSISTLDSGSSCGEACAEGNTGGRFPFSLYTILLRYVNDSGIGAPLERRKLMYTNTKAIKHQY